MLGPLTTHHIVYSGFADISNLCKCFGVSRTKESHQSMLTKGEMDEKHSPHSIALSLEDLAVQFHLKKKQKKHKHCFFCQIIHCSLQVISFFFLYTL